MLFAFATFLQYGSACHVCYANPPQGCCTRGRCSLRSAVAERTPRDPHELIVQVLMFVAHGIKGGTECSGPGSGAMYADRFGSSSSRGAVYAIASVSSPSL